MDVVPVLIPTATPNPSPSVEHIIVELQNLPPASSSSGWLAVAAALSAALVTGMLTHDFTRTRDHQNWLREKLFEVIQQLDIHYNVIIGVSNKIMTVARKRISNQEESIGDSLIHSETEKLSVAQLGYEGAIRRIALLLRTERHMHAFWILDNQAFLATWSAINALQCKSDMYDLEGLINDCQARVDRFSRTHKGLIKAITAECFTFKPQKSGNL